MLSPDRLLAKTLTIAMLVATSAGCSKITATRMKPFSFEPKGIPFYLPKPYLVVTKNVRHVQTPTVGLTETVPVPNSFDASFRELSMTGNLGSTGNTNVDVGGDPQAQAKAAEPQPAPPPVPALPGHGAQVVGIDPYPVTPASSISDGLAPETFFTYEVVYLPDLTQKYGLQVRHLSGEMRATMNLVNGWMHTGAGPIYMKDSSSAANIAAMGMATSAVIDSLGRAGAAGAGAPATPAGQAAGITAEQLRSTQRIRDYAEIYVYEPYLIEDEESPSGESTQWRLVMHHLFDRDHFGPAPITLGNESRPNSDVGAAMRLRAATNQEALGAFVAALQGNDKLRTLVVTECIIEKPAASSASGQPEVEILIAKIQTSSLKSLETQLRNYWSAHFGGTHLMIQRVD